MITGKTVTIDFESKGLYGEFLCFSFKFKDETTQTLIDPQEVVRWFSALPQGTEVWAFNVEYEYLYAKDILGVDVSRFKWNCAKVLAHTINHNFKGSYSSLKFISTTLLGEGEGKLDYSGNFSCLTDELITYNRRDVEATEAIVDVLLTKYIGKFIHKNVAPSKRKEWVKEIKSRILKVYSQRMEFVIETLIPARVKGLYIDVETLKNLEEYIDEYNQSLPVVFTPVIQKDEPKEVTYTKGCYKSSKNLISHYQGMLHVAPVVYNHCPIKSTQLTSFTDKSVAWYIKNILGLPELINDSGNVELKHPPKDNPDLLKVYIAYKLLKYSGYFKNYRKYGELTQDEYLVVRSNLDICGTLTGRLSSSCPNIQNIGGSRVSEVPELAEFQKSIRKIVVPPKGDTLIGADIDRAELMILAKILSNFGDNGLAEKINNNEDIHSYNAQCWGLQRVQAKSLVFSIMYGATEYKVAEIVGCSHSEAKDVIQRIKKGTPALEAAMEYYKKQCRLLGGVFDLFGDFKTYPQIRSNNKHIIAATERQLFNSVIQGTNASLMSWLCPQISRLLAKYGGYIFAIIHDEVLIYTPTDTATEVAEKLNTTWNNNYNIPNLEGLRFGMEFKVGATWLETK